MKALAVISLTAGLLLAGDTAGIRPRGDATDYPAHQTAAGVTVAAAVIAPEKVAKLFATDLNRGGYLVVEVAVYPEAGGEVNLMARDFLLRAGSDPAGERPATAEAVAGSLQRKNTPKPHNPGDIAVHPAATIGYETGGYGGQRRGGGVYTDAGVGVSTGNPGPPPGASTDQDRAAMRQELEDKGLPEGRTTQAVAGYLYFPKPSPAKRGAGYQITYYAAVGQVTLKVPAPAKK